MKIKSLLLGSIAAAGLSTGAFAADLNVLTSLDVCDSLGISGLTISSDTNCLQISGHVDYEFNWGDNDGGYFVHSGHDNPGGDSVEYIDNGGVAGDEMDWASSIDAWLQFVGTANSDFGPASVTIKFDYDHDDVVVNEAYVAGDSINRLRIQDAFVSVGDSTVIMAGQKSSIFDKSNDVALTWLEPYNSVAVDHGVDSPASDFLDGGPTHSIQIVSDLGNGVSISGGLENLNGDNFVTTDLTAADGVFVGVISYAGDDITAHASVIGGGFLDGTIESWGFHAGFEGTFDNFNIVAALAADNNDTVGADYWNAMVSASATFDMFTLAAAVEGVNTYADVSQFGGAGSITAEVSDGVTINAGFRWFDEDTSVGATETWQMAASVAAAVTETVTITGELGYVSTNLVRAAEADITYGSVELAWAPGGGYTSSILGRINSAGGYKVTYKAAKTFN